MVWPAILAQAIFVQTVRCACAFAEGDSLCLFCAPVRRIITVRKGWSVMEIPSDGWVKVLRGRRPPSEEWLLMEPENHRGRWRHKQQAALSALGPEENAAKVQIQEALRRTKEVSQVGASQPRHHPGLGSRLSGTTPESFGRVGRSRRTRGRCTRTIAGWLLSQLCQTVQHRAFGG